MESLFELILNQEKSDADSISGLLKEQACSEEFFKYINLKALDHFNFPSKYKRVYLLIYGFGSIFPYLRTSELLKNFEQYLSGSYKLITFFPGTYEHEHYHLFGMLNDENIYRATLINK